MAQHHYRAVAVAGRPSKTGVILAKHHQGVGGTRSAELHKQETPGLADWCTDESGAACIENCTLKLDKVSDFALFVVELKFDRLIIGHTLTPVLLSCSRGLILSSVASNASNLSLLGMPLSRRLFN
ncbi:hypothetical protein D3C86_1835730 [compost metagenome]